MEGSLYKWDGYFTGWNKRYCAISNGKLDIYPSKESMNKGSSVLESHNIGLCEISVDPNSETQWELKGPNNSTVCFKTDLKKERQRWLKILGSVKACMMDTSVLPEALTSTNSPLDGYSEENLSHRVSTDVNQELPDKNEIIQESPEIAENETNDISKTMDGFIEFCDLFETKISSVRNSVESRSSKESIRQNSLELIGMFGKFASLVEILSDEIDSSAVSDKESSEIEKSEEQQVGENEIISPSNIEEKIEIGPKVKTFFSMAENSFQVVIDDASKHESTELLCSIQTKIYLQTCSNYTTFFDLFGGTLFSPLKSDMLANIEKIKRGMNKDPVRYSVLQYMIDDEIRNKKHKDSNGVTQALLWMMRGLRTIAGFFHHSSNKDTDSFKSTQKALDIAYSKSLKRHHNFVVQKMFTMGIKLIPSFKDMVRQVKIEDQVQPNENEEIEITGQMLMYSEAMLGAIKLIEPIYHHYKIEL